MAKIAIEIRALLGWALVEEMPKQARFLSAGAEDFDATPSAWAAIERLAVLGVRVDTSGAAPIDRLPEPPHPDAFVVDAAVRALASAELAMPQGFDALGDCIGLTDAERAEAHRLAWDIADVRGDRLAALVERRVRAGGEPTWRDHGPIYRRTVKGANGKALWFRMVNEAEPGQPARPREVDGRNPKTRKPYTGAYRKTYLYPSPSLLIAERIEYQAWAMALRVVADAVRHRLAHWRLLDTMPPLWPWEGEQAQGAPRLLVSRISTEARQEVIAGA